MAQWRAFRRFQIHARHDRGDRRTDDLDGRNLIASDDWRVICASVIGSSHDVSQTRCQDAHAVGYATGSGMVTPSSLRLLTGREVPPIAILERARRRHARCGWWGEYLATEETLGQADLARILREVRDAVSAEARERERPVGDFACTILVLVAAPSRTLAAHIGDGAIIITDDGELRVLTWPEQGEYANVTNFLTTPNGVENGRIAEAGPIARSALFSDGLQNLALDYAAQSVFAQFFEPMFRPLENPEANRVKLEAALGSYLVDHQRANRWRQDPRSGSPIGAGPNA